MSKRLLCSILVLSMFLFTLSWVVPVSIVSPNESNIKLNDDSQPFTLFPKGPDSRFSTADLTTNGILNPLVIEQVGYTPSGTINARTDTNYNTAYDMYLDDAHSWIGSRADIQVRNLRRLYVLNGTFSEGTAAGDTINPDGTADFYPYGWGADSTSGNIDQVQRVRYEDTSREYIVVENKAKLTNNPQHQYTHYAGTSVYWNQSINLDSTTTDFLLNFDYLYEFGPINGTGPQSVPEDCYVEVLVNGTVIYSISLIDLTLRNYWYSSGNIPVSISIGSGPVDFRIGININNTILLDADFDYDYTPGTDGASNAEYITVYIDDVSFIAANPPSFENVDLQYNVEGTSKSILGSNGEGSTSITNSWISDPVHMSVTSNTTVSFEYETQLLSHRFSNSTWSTDISKEGASYTINLGESPQITFHTYNGFQGDYVNLTTRIMLPLDWENVTIFDPFLSDVTHLCNLSGNIAEIPTSLLTRLGWWTINTESPNYLSSIEIQKYYSLSDTWSTQSIFRSTNKTRAAISIGTATQTPDTLGLVNVTWLLPNGTEWIGESLPGGVSGSLNSTPHVFGALNTSAGVWTTCVSWQNGSEIAFGSATFEVHHATSLTPHKALIETETGSTVTNFVYFIDVENGEFLMDTVASISANWSITTVDFSSDEFQNRWFGEFDTSLIGPGNNLVIVTANRPYYDEAICTFIVYCTFADNELIIDNPPSEIGLGDTFIATFQYLDQYGIGIESADIGIDYTGTPGGLSWEDPQNTVDGNYSVLFTAHHSDSYAITISASKEYYAASEDTLFLFVGEISTTLTLENGSAAVIPYGEQFQLVVRYVNGTGHGLDTANVSIASMTPETGLDYADAIPMGNGYYSILLTPQESNTFTIVINASQQDHRTRIASFTLTATSIQSRLTAEMSKEVIATDQTTFVILNLTSAVYGALDGANVTPYNPPTGLSFSATTPLTNGLYNITIYPNKIGSYQIVFIAYAVNHNEATTLVTLEVTAVPTILRVAGGSSSAEVEFSSDFDLLVFFERQDNPVNISSADITVIFTSFETLDWENISLPEGYIIRFTTDKVGRWEFTITASKPGHETEDIQFVLFIKEIGAELTGFSPSEDLSYGNSYSFTFHYYLTDNDSAGISDALITATGIGSDWMTFEDLGNGYYNVTIVPEGLGHQIVELKFQKTGYQERIAPFEFTVAETEIQVVMQTLIWYRYQDLNITIQLIEVDSGNPVSEALVSFQLIRSQIIELEGFLNETDTSGVYVSIVNPRWFDGTGYKLRILAEKENYVLVGNYYETDVVQYVREEDVVAQFIATVLPPIGGLAIFTIVSVIGQMVYSKRKKAQLAIDLLNKKRFDDADNIIGVIVMHKKSGIPIYSRIVKGGFEEGIVAAFISAVTHFREEFEMFDDEAMTVIPISDIIRAVQTRNLICAFITVRSASIEHNRKMESYGMQVGTYLDDLFDDAQPSAILDEKVTGMLDYIYETTMDGFLLRFYKSSTPEKFPRRYRSLEQLLLDLETRHCSKPIYMAHGVATFGVSEARGCTLVLEAIEKQLLIQCEEHEPTVEDVDFTKFLEKPDGID